MDSTEGEVIQTIVNAPLLAEELHESLTKESLQADLLHAMLRYTKLFTKNSIPISEGQLLGSPSHYM